MISAGTTASITHTVESTDTAIALGSGDVAALGTPRVVALCEEAAVAALAGQLPEGATSVGANVNIDHVAASAVGRTVSASATVSAVEGRKISFDLVVTESDTIAARGSHIRYVVDRSRFEASL